MARKILVVDDTRNMQTMLRDFLETHDFEVVVAGDGLEALEALKTNTVDLILLDIMMPNMDGFQFITQLKRMSNIPVIMVTARQQESDLIKGFELGADDYVTKPFRFRELLMRMRAVLRRAGTFANTSDDLIFGDIVLNRGAHKVTKNGESIELTPLEFFILETLMSVPGQVVRRAELSIRLIENGFSGSEATIKIHIRNIRQKIGDNLNQPIYIETVFGIGYRFLESAA